MKLFFIVFLTVLCCGCVQPKKSGTDFSQTVNTSNKINNDMESNSLILKLGQSVDLFIPRKGVVPILLEIEIKPQDLVYVERIELTEDKKPKNLKPGDAFPAYFQVTGKTNGTGYVEFFEQPIGEAKSSRHSIAKYKIAVR